MKPNRTLGLLIGCCVLSLVVWTSNAQALSSLVITDGTNTATISGTGFTSAASGTIGCLAGYSCFTLTDWSGSMTFGSWLTITTGGQFTSGPVINVKDITTIGVIAMNGAIFQGSSTGAGQLDITVTTDLLNLTAGAKSLGLIESGAFLSSTSVAGDTLSMQGLLNGSSLATISTAASGSGTSSAYSLNLAPTVNATGLAGNDVLSYKWTYKYTNAAGSTSRFSDPVPGNVPPGPPTCDPSGPPGINFCADGIGGGVAGVFDPNSLSAQTEWNNLGTIVCPGGCPGVSSVPEPSTLLLLGFGLLGGGLFFAARSRNQRQLP